MVNHLENFPAGDYHAQMLLAMICAMMHSYLGSSAHTKKFTPFDFAPWLRTPEEREALLSAKKAQEESNQKLIIQSLPRMKQEKSSA